MKMLLTIVSLSILIALPAIGAEKEQFTPERFEELQNQGELVLIDVFASWCPTCAKQQKIIERFRQAHPDVSVKVLTVDFDDQKEWVKHFKAPRQSTLYLYRNHEQLWFSVAETRDEPVFAAILDAASAH